MRTELIDRFGSLPDAGKFLLANAAIRLQAQALGIKRIEAHEKVALLSLVIKIKSTQVS